MLPGLSSRRWRPHPATPRRRLEQAVAAAGRVRLPHPSAAVASSLPPLPGARASAQRWQPATVAAGLPPRDPPGGVPQPHHRDGAFPAVRISARHHGRHRPAANRRRATRPAAAPAHVPRTGSATRGGQRRATDVTSPVFRGPAHPDRAAASLLARRTGTHRPGRHRPDRGTHPTRTRSDCRNPSGGPQGSRHSGLRQAARRRGHHRVPARRRRPRPHRRRDGGAPHAARHVRRRTRGQGMGPTNSSSATATARRACTWRPEQWPGPST